MPPPGRRFDVNSIICLHRGGTRPQTDWFQCASCRENVEKHIRDGTGYLSLEVRKLSTKLGIYWPNKPRRNGNNPGPLAHPPVRGRSISYPQDAGKFLEGLPRTNLGFRKPKEAPKPPVT
jgi:hypothetical protein